MAALAVNKAGAGPEGGRGPGGGGRGSAGAAVKVRRRLGPAPVAGRAVRAEDGAREACGTGCVPWGAGLMAWFWVFFFLCDHRFRFSFIAGEVPSRASSVLRL